jgi:DNA-binding Xre family transcriptional regulator
MDMRLRLPELLDERKTTAYQVAKDSGGRILPATLYRIAREEGRVKLFSADLCEALCDVLKVQPGELFELETEKPKRRKSA